MAGTKKKDEKRRVGRSDGTKHWLGVGEIGQESLFLDLDPVLYLLDQTIASSVNRVFHRIERMRRRPSAILVPPFGQLSWQLSYLATKFDVAVWTGDDDPAWEEAEEHFNVQCFSGNIPLLLHGNVSLFLFLEKCWKSSGEFVNALREAEQSLTEDGTLLAVLETTDKSIVWGEGSSTPVDEIINGKIFSLPKPTNCYFYPLSDVAKWEDFGVSDFLKRNREFFGRNARDLCLARMRETDFKNKIANYEATTTHATLLAWDMPL